jgi:hypothetical protein
VGEDADTLVTFWSDAEYNLHFPGSIKAQQVIPTTAVGAIVQSSTGGHLVNRGAPGPAGVSWVGKDAESLVTLRSEAEHTVIYILTFTFPCRSRFTPIWSLEVS